jgi:murein DD-endopeptidase MepM/ murein hydrolase activator NlpD
MRHASKAATHVTAAALLAAAIAGPWATMAQALDSPGGTPAVAASSSASAPADAAQAGGATAPSTHGTGGTEYGIVLARSRASGVAPPHKHSHSSRRPSFKPKAKPKPKVLPKPKPKPKPSKPAPAPVPPAGSATPPGVPTPAQTVSEGALFPVIGEHSFGNAENRFGAGRVGHIHEGQDVLASEGQEVVAPLAGTIITTAYQAGGAGWYAAEHTVDGLDFFYAHCQAGSLAVSAEQTVSAGQAICKVGQTGDATGPHLHFEVWVGGWQAAGGYAIDPLPYLEAWEHVGGG